jgi:hypothetical protein
MFCFMRLVDGGTHLHAPIRSWIQSQALLFKHVKECGYHDFRVLTRLLTLYTARLPAYCRNLFV